MIKNNILTYYIESYATNIYFPLIPVLLIFLIVYILYRIFKNPFKYPYFIHTFDITSKRNVKPDDYIDNFLLNKNNWNILQQHQLRVLQWKNENEKFIQSCVLKKYRAKQYKKILDENYTYCFKFVRFQTRYKQVNYVKTPYKVSVTDTINRVSWNWLEERYNKLKSIGFEATLNEYNSKTQRKLMTHQLKMQIKQRDNYTCQNCGKYMPDEVGLHIDHIIPIAKGGKSVPSNLRVLCSKCNGKKGAK
ncbi:MAG: HNH endonuclease [Acutalibacteraceae bacterium]|nr:HNH endonuclease [Acutalibacteraceae bacterium]